MKKSAGHRSAALQASLLCKKRCPAAPLGPPGFFYRLRAIVLRAPHSRLRVPSAVGYVAIVLRHYAIVHPLCARLIRPSRAPHNTEISLTFSHCENLIFRCWGCHSAGVGYGAIVLRPCAVNPPLPSPHSGGSPTRRTAAPTLSSRRSVAQHD